MSQLSEAIADFRPALEQFTRRVTATGQVTTATAIRGHLESAMRELASLDQLNIAGVLTLADVDVPRVREEGRARMVGTRGYDPEQDHSLNV
jgi:hypothetical protein